MSQEWCDRLWDYLDGDLDEAEARSFREHLAACPSCRLDSRDYEMVAEALRWDEDWEPPPAVLQNLLEEFRLHLAAPTPGLRDRRPMGSLLRRRIELPAWAAALLVMAIAGLVYLSQGSYESNEPGAGAAAPTAEDVERVPRELRVSYRVLLPDGTVRAVTRLEFPVER